MIHFHVLETEMFWHCVRRLTTYGQLLRYADLIFKIQDDENTVVCILSIKDTVGDIESKKANKKQKCGR